MTACQITTGAFLVIASHYRAFARSLGILLSLINFKVSVSIFFCYGSFTSPLLPKVHLRFRNRGSILSRPERQFLVARSQLKLCSEAIGTAFESIPSNRTYDINRAVSTAHVLLSNLIDLRLSVARVYIIYMHA